MFFEVFFYCDLLDALSLSHSVDAIFNVSSESYCYMYTTSDNTKLYPQRVNVAVFGDSIFPLSLGDLPPWDMI